MNDDMAAARALSELVERLATTYAPDRELDYSIECAINKYATRALTKYYTASIDAAQSLVPEGWFVAMLNESASHRWFCALHSNVIAEQTHSEFPFAEQTKTAPLAICIAALKARLAGARAAANTPVTPIPTEDVREDT